MQYQCLTQYTHLGSPVDLRLMSSIKISTNYHGLKLGIYVERNIPVAKADIHCGDDMVKSVRLKFGLGENIFLTVF